MERADYRFGSSGLLGEVRQLGRLVGAAVVAAVKLALERHPKAAAETVCLSQHHSPFIAERPISHPPPAPLPQNPAAAQAAEQAAALEDWVELLRSRDQLEASAAAAQVHAGVGGWGERCSA